jgi:hypothetical protein
MSTLIGVEVIFNTQILYTCSKCGELNSHTLSQSVENLGIANKNVEKSFKFFTLKSMNFFFDSIMNGEHLLLYNFFSHLLM